MKTISSAVSKIVLKIFVGTALTSTIVIATYKALNALEFYFVQFEQGPLWELVCYVPIILFCYGILHFNTQSLFTETKSSSKVSENQSDTLIQNMISRFTLGFLEGFEAQAQQQQTSKENPKEMHVTRPLSGKALNLTI